MKNNKLVKNLQQLSPKQWRSFLDYIQSPFFNNHRGIIVLAHYLHSCHPKWLSKNLDRHLLFEHCFPHQVFRFQVLKDLFSKLQKHLRHFIAISQFEEQAEWQHSALVRGAFAMGMQDLWQQQNKQFKQNYSNSYHAFSLLEVEKNYILKQQNRRKTKAVIEKQVDWLESFFWKERFRLAVEDISMTKVLNVQTNNQDVQILNNLPRRLLKDKTINRYKLTYQMLQLDYPKSKKAFIGLLESIKENDFSGCSAEESYAFYLYALNYCTAQINSGNPAYYAYLFTIYELLDFHGRLIQNKTLSQWTFINIVATACYQKKFDWAATFIENYHVFIPREQRKNALVYNLALLHFHKNEYDQALGGLQKITTMDAYYALNARVLELRIFYKKQEWLVLDALFERFRIYLLRDKNLPNERKKGSQVFLKLAKTLANLSQEPRRGELMKKQIEQLLKEVASTKWLIHRSWLREIGQKLLDNS